MDSIVTIDEFIETYKARYRQAGPATPLSRVSFDLAMVRLGKVIKLENTNLLNAMPCDCKFVGNGVHELKCER